ncbi:glutamyl-tRNA reductase [Tenuibacillus multivorans]|uniref:Glutamyl-tRNA reductase n=1 Tax=Tenuibacillus multivorans TaxID=237069 RepID=A0A1G9ZM95_9BACI|nr:glutamyl-tRNA reductase [Tenuibacillus multivorans]GEL77439.1 glutamyl-tRNA reductase [Tenuibacillus multivorans]SDN22448.1 glutamyl-tRNA reductase [Tenuibacillus multivorans]
MHVIVVSLNYRTAPVEVREKLAFPEKQVSDAMVALNQEKSILENVIVSTCNRTEIYVVADQLHTGRYYVKRFMANWFNEEIDFVTNHVEILEDKDAIQRLFHVSAGLDSMVLGETQILGQVKDAFQTAQEYDASGLIFNQLFKQVITTAKRSHRETEIGEHAVSISYAAVELSKTIFDQLQEQHVVILGAGKMGDLAVQNLYGSGVEKITVVNRTYAKAEELAARFSGDAKSLDQFEEVLENADILIASAGANDFVLNKDQVGRVLKKRHGKPLFLVDIAVPRNLDPEIDELENVFLYDIDDLQGIVDQNLEERKKAAAEIETMISEEIKEFEEWLTTLGVVPVISALRNKALVIQEQTMASIERKMPDLTNRERKVLNKHTKSIINQMLKEPILQAKEMAGEEHADDMLKLFIRVFGIDEEVKQELEKQSQKHQSHEMVRRSLPVKNLIQSIQHS